MKKFNLPINFYLVEQFVFTELHKLFGGYYNLLQSHPLLDIVESTISCLFKFRAVLIDMLALLLNEAQQVAAFAALAGDICQEDINVIHEAMKGINYSNM